jgi:glycosyltransferase involved in cell wall biosynthesis
MPQVPKFCLGMLPRTRGVGGMVTFQAKLESGLAQHGIDVTYELNKGRYDAVLVVGGTRKLGLLRKIHAQGIPILQRLDGMNWIHRKRRTGLRHFIRAEIANGLLAGIRSRWASGIIYQSYFVQGWWEQKYGVPPVPNSIVHNGVDLEAYSPKGEHHRPTDRIRVLLVEGSLAGGYELGLEHAIAFCERLASRIDLQVELMIVGKAAESTRLAVEERATIPLRWEGLVAREKIPELDRSAHIFFAADIHPACPNAVIEALACGLPVVAFDTGALKELVPAGGGEIVPYGSDPWKLEAPDFDALADAAVAVVKDQAGYRSRARAHAERSLGLGRMVTGYLAALGWTEPSG